MKLADAQKKLEDWRKYYDEGRSDGSIGQKTPIMLLNHIGAAVPPPCIDPPTIKDGSQRKTGTDSLMNEDKWSRSKGVTTAEQAVPPIADCGRVPNPVDVA